MSRKGKIRCQDEGPLFFPVPFHVPLIFCLSILHLSYHLHISYANLINRITNLPFTQANPLDFYGTTTWVFPPAFVHTAFVSFITMHILCFQIWPYTLSYNCLSKPVMVLFQGIIFCTFRKCYTIQHSVYHMVHHKVVHLLYQPKKFFVCLFNSMLKIKGKPQ